MKQEKKRNKNISNQSLRESNMDALTLLNEHVDIEILLNHYDFDKIKRQGNMVRACCKLHGGKNPSGFVARSDNNLYYCHTGGCGGGDVYTLVQQLEDVSFQEAVQIVANIFGVNIDTLEITERQNHYMQEMKAWIKAMRSRVKKEKNEYHITDNTRAVTKFRDFLPATLDHFGLQYVERIHLLSRENKPYVLNHRLLFPVVVDKVQIGISLRRIKGTDNPKWSHQPVTFETREVLYNYDAVLGLSTIVVCEGIVDVWAWYEVGIHAVCTFGAHVTEEQYRLLMRTGADIVWSFDGDEAGREATRKALELFRNKANQYVVYFDEEEDPASITREELAKRYERRETNV